MPIETIEFKGKTYPKFQSTGNAARFCMAYAKELLKGDVILDIGYGQEDWKFPGAIGIDKKDNSEFDAMNLPPLQVDGIFSSHLLEHLERPFDALDIWTNKLKSSGVIVLYLPAPTQEYWLPFSTCNPKHLSSFTPEVIRKYFEFSGKYKKIFVSGIDAYDSFLTFAEKI